MWGLIGLGHLADSRRVKTLPWWAAEAAAAKVPRPHYPTDISNHNIAALYLLASDCAFICFDESRRIVLEHEGVGTLSFSPLDLVVCKAAAPFWGWPARQRLSIAEDCAVDLVGDLADESCAHNDEGFFLASSIEAGRSHNMGSNGLQWMLKQQPKPSYGSR